MTCSHQTGPVFREYSIVPLGEPCEHGLYSSHTHKLRFPCERTATHDG